MTRAAIESGNRAFIAAFRRGDARAVAEQYTEDAQVIPPGADVASGRPAIAAFWQSLMDAGVETLALDTTEVQSAGDLAYEVGAVTVTGRSGQVTEGRYVVVWKRQHGRWMIHRDIWNSSR
jgi:uncharacterized protein (TIGR02246 family)